MTIVVGARVPGCTLKDLRTRLQGRLSDLTDQTADYFINDAHREFHEMFDWPWLNVEATGANPLTLTNLGLVQYVIDDTTGRKLDWRDRNYIVNQVSPDLTVRGNAIYWYRNGIDEIASFPVTGGDLRVSHWQEVGDLVADGDETLNPARYCPLVLNLAYAKAMGDKQDENNIADALLKRAETRIARVWEKVGSPSIEPGRIQMKVGGE